MKPHSIVPSNLRQDVAENKTIDCAAPAPANAPAPAKQTQKTANNTSGGVGGRLEKVTFIALANVFGLGESTCQKGSGATLAPKPPKSVNIKIDKLSSLDLFS